jgi:hypothetical protein
MNNAGNIEIDDTGGAYVLESNFNQLWQENAAQNEFELTIPSFSSLPSTFYNNRITPNHIIRRGSAQFTAPEKLASNITYTTASGSITLSGTILGPTGLTITLWIPPATATAS